MNKEGVHPLIDEERQRLARRYRGEQRRLGAFSFFLSVLFIGALIYFDLSAILVACLEALIATRFFVVTLYFIVLYTAYSILHMPFSYFSGYVIEQRYHFSTQSIGSWVIDWIKSFFIGAILGLIVFHLIYAITYAFPDLWWLWLSLCMVMVSVVLANLVPVCILPLFYTLKPLEDDDLHDKVQRLCQKAGIEIKGIFTIDLSRRSTKANAAVVGLGRTKRIVLGDTLLKDYSHEEVLSVLAHEITHYQEHHIWQLIIWQSVITVTTFYLLYMLYPHIYPLLGYGSVHEIASFPGLVLIFGGLSVLLRPVNAAISRYYERRSDRGALEITRDADSFIRVMAKFCNNDLAVAYPHPIIEWYKYSHPSPGRRIQRAEVWQRQHEA